ncbi:ATP-binding protein [Arhodomonas aquaeolei]|uniref:sensor histidine kinase n=1 Tax=Arhodomonas aquaeolei TaxID=2369 RepID=UPI00216A999E|nr:ATP-binding protein [Arhodomonas aquaeolei]MCS4503855.1 ATP-binding protein [Arhodomonas aquaeolei]
MMPSSFLPGLRGLTGRLFRVLSGPRRRSSRLSDEMARSCLIDQIATVAAATSAAEAAEAVVARLAAAFGPGGGAWLTLPEGRFAAGYTEDDGEGIRAPVPGVGDDCELCLVPGPAYRGGPGEHLAALVTATADLVGLFRRGEAHRRARAADEAYLRVIASTAEEGICRVALDGRVLDANEAFARMYDCRLEELIGHCIMEYLPPQIAERIRTGLAARAEGRSERYELHLHPDTPQERWLMVSASPVRGPDGRVESAFAMVTDITALKLATREAEQARERAEALQAEMLRTAKLAAVGQMAAGVAHEINNPIGFVRSNLGTLREYVGVLEQAAAGDDDVSQEKLAFVREDIPELLSESEAGIQRVADTVRTLRGFARDDSGEWTGVDLNEVAVNALRIAGPRLKGRARTLREFSAVPTVRGSPVELSQVLVNLLINAANALDGHGTIRVVTRCEGDEAVLEVADDGRGMSEEERVRVFEPFYSRSGQEGTGLGLSIVQNIVERHGGRIELASELGAGSRFSVRLPAAADVEPAVEAPGG